MDKAFLKQAWVVSGTLINMMTIGMFLGFNSFLLPALRDPNSSIQADLDKSSWIVASFGFAWIPGFFISSFYMDRYGRKMAFLLDMIPGGFGLVLMYFATNVYALIAASVLEGITSGGTAILGSIIIGEYSSPVNRGMFLTLKTVALNLGTTVIHMLGHHFHWRTVACISLLPYLVTFGMVFSWPESPCWLIIKGDYDNGSNIFYYLRGKNEQSINELAEMIRVQKEKPKPVKLSFFRSTIAFIKKFGKRNFVMPLTVFLCAAIMLESTGRQIFPAYSTKIISGITGSNSTFYYTLCLDILVTVSATFSSVLVKLIKRRTLLFTTGLASLLVLFMVCLYLYLVSIDVITRVSWIPIVLFGLYLIIVNLACTPIPRALVGEIFPLEHKAAGTTMSGIIVSLTSVISLKSTPFLLAAVNVYGTFTIFGTVMAITLFILYFLMPETKDRTLQEIEDYFSYGRFRNNNAVDDVKMEAKMIP